MWAEQECLPKTEYGQHMSGTTANVAFIRQGKIYIGHVADSSIVLGYQDDGEILWKGRPLTRDHKPESADETGRIVQSDGKVVGMAEVPKVVWTRPRIQFGYRSPVRISTDTDEIPFLAISRSIGDLWSYNAKLDEFVVSPEPYVGVIPVEAGRHRCLILGTHGLWNVLNPNAAVVAVQEVDRLNNEKNIPQEHNTVHPQVWIGASETLVNRALNRWSAKGLLAENTTALIVMLD
jgi:protein phosphatase 1D